MLVTPIFSQHDWGAKNENNERSSSDRSQSQKVSTVLVESHTYKSVGGNSHDCKSYFDFSLEFLRVQSWFDYLHPQQAAQGSERLAIVPMQSLPFGFLSPLSPEILIHYLN